MAAQPLPAELLTRQPLLLGQVEGAQDAVSMAAIVPKEEGLISVSEDSLDPGEVLAHSLFFCDSIHFQASATALFPLSLIAEEKVLRSDRMGTLESLLAGL
ncbi:UNVERIFIED_CONTAM: hypothetical protein K2H54_035916 [Gekko kuhli]